MEKLLLQGLVLVVTFAFLVNIYKKIKKTQTLHKYVDVFPGDKWYPIVGTTWRFFGVPREDVWATLKGLCNQYGPTWRIWSGTSPMVFISKVEHLEMVFKHTKNINKGSSYQFLRPWLGEGLITASGNKWRRNRKLLTSAFHFKVLDKYSEVFNSKSKEVVEIFEQNVGGDYLNIFPFLTRCGLDIIAETAMGIKFDTLKDPDSEYANAILKLCEIASKRTRSFVRKDFLFQFTELGQLQKKYLNIVKTTNMRIISERKAYYEKHKSKTVVDDSGIKTKLAFLDLLLQNHDENQFTDREIYDEVSTFMFAGQDTTASAITYALLALGNNPEIEEKVHNELDDIFKGEERPITPQDVADMEYLDRVVKESLRMFSIIPIVGRTLDESIIVDGKIIPPGVTVQLCIYQVHHDPEHWHNPDKFDPDRFLPENAKNRHPYAFVPFSAGPRNCIGQKFGTRNAKTMLAALLRKFKISCLEKSEDIKVYNEVVLKPQNGVHVKFEYRNKKV